MFCVRPSLCRQLEHWHLHLLHNARRKTIHVYLIKSPLPVILLCFKLHRLTLYLWSADVHDVDVEKRILLFNLPLKSTAQCEYNILQVFIKRFNNCLTNFHFHMIPVLLCVIKSSRPHVQKKKRWLTYHSKETQTALEEICPAGGQIGLGHKYYVTSCSAFKTT